MNDGVSPPERGYTSTVYVHDVNDPRRLSPAVHHRIFAAVIAVGFAAFVFVAVQLSASTILVGAVIIPVVSAGSVVMARWCGRWIRRAIIADVRGVIRETAAPDIEAGDGELRASIDALREAIQALAESNGRDHEVVQTRLGELTSRVEALEQSVGELTRQSA